MTAARLFVAGMIILGSGAGMALAAAFSPDFNANAAITLTGVGMITVMTALVWSILKGK